MMVLAQDEARVHQVIDTAQGRSPALAGVAAFSSAMASLPADRLATAWYDLRPTIQQAAASAAPDSAGFSTLALALRAEEAGFRVTAQLPVDPGSAGAAVRDALAAGAQVAQLANAMPADTEVAAMFFNLRAALQRAEAEIKARDQNVGSTIDQLRGLAAFGLGINIDNDLLPLLDGEVGVSVSGVTDQPHGVLLLRPTDAGAASTALDRIDQALSSRGISVDRTDVAGATVVTATVPQVGAVSWRTRTAWSLGLAADDVKAALEARAGSQTLDTVARYRDAFADAERGGTEVYVDLKSLMPMLLAAAGDSLRPSPA